MMLREEMDEPRAARHPREGWEDQFRRHIRAWRRPGPNRRVSRFSLGRTGVAVGMAAD